MLRTGKSSFALYFGNRGFFPASLLASAREELTSVLQRMGHETIAMDAGATRHGAVETPAEGALYARFLEENRGRFDGVILCLPNFGDENGAVAALRDARVPILVHAYPDEMDKMAPELRRDAFCGKLSIMDVFCQNGIPFTALKPHVCSPQSAVFGAHVEHFDRVCRVVSGMRRLTVGAIGARTSAFKTVRIDEVALQRAGITMETYDLADVFARLRAVSPESQEYRTQAARLKQVADFGSVPAEATDNLVRLSVVLDSIVQQDGLDCLALRCWIEMQQQLGISPCIVLGELSDRGIPAACEVDVGNAVAMTALHLASGSAPACLDWNNNYGEDEDKCILFHCGPVPASMMTCRGEVADHAILANAVGEGCSYGCNVGRIAPTDFTFSSLTTQDGRLRFYVGEGTFTDDAIPSDFFGCAGVAQIPDLQDVLLHVGRNGHRHHVSVTAGHLAEPVQEALEYYLGNDVTRPQTRL